MLQVVRPEEIDRTRRLYRVEAQRLQCLTRGLEARAERLPLGGFDVEVAQPEAMHAIARAGEDRQIGKVPAHDCGGLHRRLDVVDRQHEELRVARPGRFEQLEPRCVAVVHLVAEFAHEVDLLVVHFDRRERNARHSQNARDDLTIAPVARDDHRIAGAVDEIELRRLPSREPALQQLFVCDKRERRQQHRNGHRKHQELRRLGRQDAPGLRRREQHEREFAALRKQSGDALRTLVVFSRHAHDAVQQQRLEHHHPDRDTEHGERMRAE